MNDDPYVIRFTTPVSTGVRGVLDGATFAVKDLFHVAGYATGNGNPALARATTKARTHAKVVERLLTNGAALTGITHMDELALSLNGINGHFGAVPNPRYPGRITGGSSSGSAAAVAAGDVTFSLGSDTAGSLRLPASFCGLYTLRPTYGRIDTTGMLGLAPSFDTPGVFTRDAALLGTLMRILFQTEQPIGVIRQVLTPVDLLVLCDPLLASTATRFAKKIAQHLGVPHVTESLGIDPQTLKRTLLTLLGAEAYATHQELFQRTPELLLEPTRQVLAHGRDLEPARRDAALAARQDIVAALHAALDATVMVLPAAPSLPPPIKASEAVLRDMNAQAVSLHAIGSLAQVPCAVAPVAEENDTVGMMLIAAQHTDETLLKLLSEVV